MIFFVGGEGGEFEFSSSSSSIRYSTVRNVFFVGVRGGVRVQFKFEFNSIF